MKKSALFALMASVLLAVPAMAQTRLWSWTPTAPSGYSVFSNLVASRIDSDGNTGLIFLEIYRATSDSAETAKLHVVWIGSKGGVRRDEVTNSTETVAAASGEENPVGAYQILHVGNQRMIYTDGLTVWTSKWQDKKLTTTSHAMDDGVDVIGVGQPASFPGWLQRAGTESNGNGVTISSLQLWTAEN